MHRFIARAKLSGGRVPAGASMFRVRRSWTTGYRQHRGFSLIELLVALLVAAILLMFAIPAFSHLVNEYRLKTTANTLIGSLNTARIAAIQRNVEVQFCSNSASSNTSDTLGNACGTTNAGEIVALTSPGATTTTPLQVAPSELGIPSIQIHGNVAAIRYNGQGQGLMPGTSTPFDTATEVSPVVDVCSTALSTGNHIQVNMAAGSVITTTTSTGACP